MQGEGDFGNKALVEIIESIKAAAAKRTPAQMGIVSSAMAKGQLPERVVWSVVLVVESKQPDMGGVDVHTKELIRLVAALRPSTITEPANTAAELGGMRPGPPTDTSLNRPGKVYTGTIGILGADKLSAVSELETRTRCSTRSTPHSTSRAPST
mmetsp:Transcript_44140/g.99740  ORF Transcript_44140/g.99740 Transcript_44140/m.99740 type:complete len:154 (-) Transcript_44140:83-544(-)